MAPNIADLFEHAADNFPDRLAVACGEREVTYRELEDGSQTPFTGVSYSDALASSSPERDFEPRSGDDIYLLYTGGTTGYPKGVMWRHEDVWRVLGGGIDFQTGIPAADEWAQVKRGQE